MPTITVSYEDLINLMDKKLSIEELREYLFLHKCLLESVVGDELSIEVNADRPDLLSVEGLARALRLFLKLEEPKEYSTTKGLVKVRVDPSVLEFRPFILCAIVRNVHLSDEAVKQVMMLQEKLHLTYCRGRMKASIGIHDMKHIWNEIVYAAYPPSQIRFIPLNEEVEMDGYEILTKTEKGREYAHILKGFSKYPLLHDAKGRVMSMPPIINANVTKVIPSTTDVFIDVTGIDMKVVSNVLNIICTSLIERGGFIGSVEMLYPDRVFDSPILQSMEFKVDLSEASDLIGVKIDVEEARQCLSRLGYFTYKVDNNTIRAYPPPYRCDLLHAVDVMEDIAIGYGFDRLPPITFASTNLGRELEISIFSAKLRELMVGLGFQEVRNYMLTSEEILFNNMKLIPTPVVTLENPISREYTCLRNQLLPGLLEFLSNNKHASLPQRILECDDVVEVDKEKPTRTRNVRKLACAILDYKVGYEDIQAVLYALLRNLNFKEWTGEAINHPSFITGRASALYMKGRAIAILGEIHPHVLCSFKLENPVAAFELNIYELLSLKD